MTVALTGDGRRPVVVAILATVAVASYNNLSAAAALPDIGDELGGISLLPFVITAELLTSAVAVLATGPVVDGIGARRTFRLSAVGFAVTSIVVAAAPTMAALVAARAAQGVFAGAITAVAVASIGLAFPAAVRPRAFAAISSVWGVMGVAGPAIAATMISTVGWRGIFLVNVPVTVVAAAIGWNQLPDRRPDAARQPVDVLGLVLITTLTTATLLLAADRPVVIASAAAVATLSVALYVGWARHAAHPILRLGHVTDRRFRPVHLSAAGVIGAGVGANSLLPVYLRTVRGQSTGLAAFSVLFMTVGWTGSAIVSSRLQERQPGERVCLLGTAIALPAVIAAAAVIALDAPIPLVYAAFTAVGAGVGMVTATGGAVLQGRSPEADMGRINGAHQFLRTMSITFAVATVGAIVLAVVAARTGDVELVRDALAGDDTADGPVDPEVLRALRDGYAWAIATMTVGTVAALAAAVGLARSAAPELASAP